MVRWSLKSRPPVKAILGPAGSSTSGFARRLAARKTRLSVMAAGRGRGVTRGPGGRRPRGAGVALELIGGLVAHELEGIATLDKRHAFGDEPLKLDGADFGAVLFALAAALCLLVIVECALDPLDGAME